VLLENVSIGELSEMLLPHMGKPAWPGLTDGDVRARAKQYAEKLGVWEEGEEELHSQSLFPRIPVAHHHSGNSTGASGSRSRGSIVTHRWTSGSL